tara:strand:+ start:9666 stop:10988 length:1323 start_codon:yes stop_codon:yes gene_type:complete
MVRQNQGYRRDLNLSEGTDDLKVWSALGGSGISDDLNRLQNNLKNTSKVGFNTVDGSGFFTFALDRPLSVTSINSKGSENFIAGILLSNTEITVTLENPYHLKFGDLITIDNITGVGSTILNNSFAVENVLEGFTTFTCTKVGVAYTSTNENLSGSFLTLNASDTFAFTKDDVVGVNTSVTIEVKDSSNNVIGVNTLSPNVDYYVTESDGFTKFKLSTRPSTNVLGVNVINITSNQIGVSTVVSPDNFTFIRKDPVHQTQILNYVTPINQDDDFSWLGGVGINTASDTTQANIENAQFFMNRKYRGDKSTTTSEELKFEGGIVLNDPAQYNSGASAVLEGGRAGVYIGDTRAFSTDNNPWEEIGNDDGTGTLQTESTSVSIGDLTFLDQTSGPIIIEGIASDITTISPEVNASSFTHKLPIQVKDPDGNTETYFLLLDND